MTYVRISGFDGSSRSWVPKDANQPTIQLPELDGALLMDEVTISGTADDFGHLRHLKPVAVLEPASIEDIIKVVGFAREHGIKVAARGRGHSTFGQSQVEGGILIKMSTMEIPAALQDDTIQVSAGTSWFKVIAFALRHALRPPVMTHSLELSVGGTLSVAGIDGGSYRYGAQIDNVLELQVVTGEGQLVTCSDTEQPQLFNAVLAGLGQCGIIVSAKLRLIPADSHARIFRMHYPDLSTLLHDKRLLIADGRFDRVQGHIAPSQNSEWRYRIIAGKNYTPPKIPNDQSLLQGLNFMKESIQVRDSSYFRYVDRTFQFASALIMGKYKQPQPWFHSLVPDSVSDYFISEVLSQLALEEIGEDLPIEVIALNRETLTRPLFRVPNEPVSFVFGCLLRTPDTEAALKKVERNRQFYQRARELGCKHSAISSVQLTPQEWQEHFHPNWDQFLSAKQRYDPDNILTPGPGLFE